MPLGVPRFASLLHSTGARTPKRSFRRSITYPGLNRECSPRHRAQGPRRLRGLDSLLRSRLRVRTQAGPGRGEAAPDRLYRELVPAMQADGRRDLDARARARVGGRLLSSRRVEGAFELGEFGARGGHEIALFDRPASTGGVKRGVDRDAADVPARQLEPRERAIVDATRRRTRGDCNRQICSRADSSGNENMTTQRMRRRKARSSALFTLVVSTARPR